MSHGSLLFQIGLHHAQRLGRGDQPRRHLLPAPTRERPSHGRYILHDQPLWALSLRMRRMRHPVISAALHNWAGPSQRAERATPKPANQRSRMPIHSGRVSTVWVSVAALGDTVGGDPVGAEVCSMPASTGVQSRHARQLRPDGLGKNKVDVSVPSNDLANTR
jgi:hypothetical protein